jgi:deoxycytidine triphosphate deaminase
MVLAHQDILSLCDLAANDPEDKQTDSGVIVSCVKRNVRSAGYDLRLGLEYYLPEKEGAAGALSVQTLDPYVATTISIPANRVVIVSIKESLNLPNNLVGHLSLKLDLLLKGLIMSSQSQIDAGYKGNIFALLYNLSDRAVEISYLDSILRLELQKLTADTTAPYHGAYEQIPLAQSLRSPIGSSLFALRQDIDSIETDARRTVDDIKKEVQSLKNDNRETVESVRDEARRVQIRGGLAAAGLAIFLTIITSLFTYFGPLPNRITKLEESTNVQGLRQDLHDLKALLEKEPEEKKSLLEKLDTMDKRLQKLEKQK